MRPVAPSTRTAYCAVALVRRASLMSPFRRGPWSESGPYRSAGLPSFRRECRPRRRCLASARTPPRGSCRQAARGAVDKRFCVYAPVARRSTVRSCAGSASRAGRTVHRKDVTTIPAEPCSPSVTVLSVNRDNQKTRAEVAHSARTAPPPVVTGGPEYLTARTPLGSQDSASAARAIPLRPRLVWVCPSEPNPRTVM